MRKIQHFIFVVATIFILFSCSEKETPIGKWDDIIELSTKNITFDASEDSVTINTKGDWWWVTNISVNNKIFNVPDDINVETYNYSIQLDCFLVERRDKNTLFIKVDENPLNIQRIIWVGLEAGNYFDGVSITQLPK